MCRRRTAGLQISQPEIRWRALLQQHVGEVPGIVGIGQQLGDSRSSRGARRPPADSAAPPASDRAGRAGPGRRPAACWSDRRTGERRLPERWVNFTAARCAWRARPRPPRRARDDRGGALFGGDHGPRVSCRPEGLPIARVPVVPGAPGARTRWTARARARRGPGPASTAAAPPDRRRGTRPGPANRPAAYTLRGPAAILDGAGRATAPAAETRGTGNNGGGKRQMADTRLIQSRYRLLELIGRGGMGECGAPSTSRWAVRSP